MHEEESTLPNENRLDPQQLERLKECAARDHTFVVTKNVSQEDECYNVLYAERTSVCTRCGAIEQRTTKKADGCLVIFAMVAGLLGGGMSIGPGLLQLYQVYF